MAMITRVPFLVLTLLLVPSTVVVAGPVFDLATTAEDVRMLGPRAADNLSLGSREGQGLAAGDINADGQADLVVTSVAASPDRTRPHAGEAYVILGPVRQGVLDPIGSGAALIIQGAERDEEWGSSAAVGDLDADGQPDLVLGCGTTWTMNDRGGVGIFFGPLPLDGRTLDMRTDPPGWKLDGDPFDVAGLSLAVADLNDDGNDDLAVGAPWSDSIADSRLDGGEIRVFFGPLMRGELRSMASSDLVIWGLLEVPGGTDGSRLGTLVLARDLNDDGHADLLLGLPYANASPPRESNDGAVHVLLGPLAPGAIDLQVGTADVIVRGRTTGVHALGWGISVGDLDGDSRADLAIGSSGELFPPGAPRTGEGEIDVLLGPFTTGDRLDLGVDLPDRVFRGVTRDANVGRAIALGDIDGDGALDLVAGAPRFGIGGLPRVPGQVHVVNGPIVAGPLVLLDEVTADLTVKGPGGQSPDMLGHAIVVDDVSGDSMDDLVLGAPLSDRPSGEFAAGSVHVLFGGPPDHPPTCVLSAPPRIDCSTADPCVGGHVVRLDGSGSSDIDLDLVEHRWHVDCGGAVQDSTGAIVDACLPVGCGTASCVIELTVVDARGNSSTCSSVIDVADSQPPTLAEGAESQRLLWPPNHRMRCFDTAAWSPIVTDGCDIAPTWRFVACVSDQPEDDRGDGHFRPDCEVSADGSRVCVRAERSGVLGDRHVTLWGVARDACGNESAAAAVGEVLIPHDMRAHSRRRR